MDTQEDLLGRLATVLNGADPGVSAQVVASQQDAHDPQHHLLSRTLRLSIRDSDPSVDFSLADDQGSLVGDYHLGTQTPPRAALMPELGLRATAQERLSVSGQFADKVTSDCLTVRQTMLGDGGWLLAVRTKGG